MSPFANLATELESAGIRMGQIGINETPQDCCLCILNYVDEIECFYFERGGKIDLVSFASQPVAIEHFKNWVLSNKTLYANWGGTVGQPCSQADHQKAGAFAVRLLS